MKVHYEFARDKETGARNFSDVDVSEELGAVLAELDSEEYNINRKETRRHESLNFDNDKWDTLADNTVDIENETIIHSDFEMLYSVISELKIEDQKLIYWLYLSPKPLTQLEASRNLGVTENAVKQKAKYVRAKLKEKLIKIL
jgi:DNA-directed RNA polymerase specialized sigma subunit